MDDDEGLILLQVVLTSLAFHRTRCARVTASWTVTRTWPPSPYMCHCSERLYITHSSRENVSDSRSYQTQRAKHSVSGSGSRVPLPSSLSLYFSVWPGFHPTRIIASQEMSSTSRQEMEKVGNVCFLKTLIDTLYHRTLLTVNIWIVFGEVRVTEIQHQKSFKS